MDQAVVLMGRCRGVHHSMSGYMRCDDRAEFVMLADCGFENLKAGEASREKTFTQQDLPWERERESKSWSRLWERKENKQERCRRDPVLW